MSVPVHLGLRSAVVVRPGAEACEVFADDRLAVVRYSVPFKPRADGVSPGQLVAVAATAEGPPVIIWRWFDAVVLRVEGGQVHLWEPAHGEVLAQPRGSSVRYLPGSRAYLSAGLPGADWWVEGAAAAPAGDADVDLEVVRRFYVDHDLWDDLS